MTRPVNQQWLLTQRPDGPITSDLFAWHEEAVPEPTDGQVLVRTIYLSLDPANRIWMNDEDSYMPPVGVGDVMRGLALGVVETSRDPGFAAGDLVQGAWGWQRYAAIDAKLLRGRIPPDEGVPLTAYMAVAGSIGFTAYFGLLDLGQPKPGETVVVTAAAGAVGSMVGQIAKIKGCRAVGIAGSDAKCRWLTEELGFDAAINYRSDDVPAALDAACPDGIDVVFENVGGPVFDHILERINFHARIALCGLIAQYNATDPVPGPYNFHRLLYKSARVEGFIVVDFAARFGEARAELVQWLRDGKLNYRVDVVDGLENAPTAINKLFDGSNSGKLIVKVSDEPA